MKMLRGVLISVLATAIGLAGTPAPVAAAAPELELVNDTPVGPFVTGGPATFRVLIRNNGDAPSPATTFCVVAMPDIRAAFGIPAATPGCSWPLPALAPGQSNEALFTAPNSALPLPPGNYDIEASVNADPAPTFTESNHDNNMVLFHFTVTGSQPPLWNRKKAKVTRVRILSLKPSPYKGLCPVTVEAIGEITMDGPGTARYQWNSAKFSSPTDHEEFASAGTHTVKFKVTGDSLLLSSPWRLTVSAPNEMAFTSPAPRIVCTVPAIRRVERGVTPPTGATELKIQPRGLPPR